jgi:tRNA (cmo5U34)-methyltransferase
LSFGEHYRQIARPFEWTFSRQDLDALLARIEATNRSSRSPRDWLTASASLLGVAQFHWDPDTYLELMREEVPDYEHLQEEAAAATGTGAMRVLELGIGTGETARRVLARHPTASLIGLDASREMVDQARHALPDDRVELCVARLEDPLPDGPFDVVISTLAIHHLDDRGKAQLFGRAARVIAPGGRLVIADVIVPEDPSDVVTPIDNDYDTPSSIAEQLNWLAEVGLEPSLAWAHRDLAVIIATRPATS